MKQHNQLTAQQLAALTSELVSYQDQLAAIHELAHHFSGPLDLGDALHGLVQTAVRALPVFSAAALLTLPQQAPLSVTSGDEPMANEILIEALAHIQTQGDYVLQNTNGRDLPLGCRNRLLLPLTMRTQIVGVLVLLDKHTGPFTMPDVKLGQALTAQLDTQIENTLWHQERMVQAVWQAQIELAQEVQRCLLPQSLPCVPGLDVWAMSNPLHQVGGDFYDFMTSANAAPIVSVGDVCGKGVAAAMLMTMTRTTLRNAAAFLPQSRPAQLLQHTNTALYSDYTDVGMFASLFVGQYLPEERLLRYANAGHAPVIYCPAQGDARLLPVGNASIGLLPSAAMVEATIPFGPDDVLVVATDGFTEALNDQQALFGIERLLEIVSRCACQSAANIGAVIQAVVTAFCGNQPQADDQTLVVFKGVA